MVMKNEIISSSSEFLISKIDSKIATIEDFIQEKEKGLYNSNKAREIKIDCDTVSRNPKSFSFLSDFKTPPKVYPVINSFIISHELSGVFLKLEVSVSNVDIGSFEARLTVDQKYEYLLELKLEMDKEFPFCYYAEVHD